MVVDPGLGLHPLHHLFRRPGLRRDQQLAPAVLRRLPAGADRQRQGDGLGSLFADAHLRRDRDGVDVRLRHHALLRQPLRLPLAHGDEQFLHVALAARALHRGRLAARPGGHDALRRHRRGPRRVDRLLDHDAGRLPSGAVGAVEIRHRAAAGRPHPRAAVHGADLLGRCSARSCWPSSASSCRGSNSRTSASRRPTARNSSTARTARTAPSRRRSRSSSRTSGTTISGSISTTCTSTSRAGSTSRPTTSTPT